MHQNIEMLRIWLKSIHKTRRVKCNNPDTLAFIGIVKKEVSNEQRRDSRKEN
mgnify:CR=1 FL=1